MTNTELKAALQSRKPVIFRSPRYGELKYKCVNAIRYTLDRAGEIIVQEEILTVDVERLIRVAKEYALYSKDVESDVEEMKLVEKKRRGASK